MSLTYGTVCSGIEAPSQAVHPLGWKPLWFSEIEPFPKAVLAHRHPGVPDLGDMTTIPARIRNGEVPAPDVFIGGTPCQSFSVAGLRKGLADPRGQLTRTFVEILDALDDVRTQDGKPPAICLWENVPGVLSDKENAFGNFLAALVGEDEPLLPAGPRWTDAGCVLGPTRAAAWRILDAQYFGVAQRRRRVFVVISARAGGVDPVEVLLVEPGVRRDPPTRGEAQQDAAADPRGSTAPSNGERDPGERGVGISGAVSGTLDASYHKGCGSANYGEREVVAQAYPELPEVAWCLQHRDAKGADSDTKPGHVIPVQAAGGFFDQVSTFTAPATGTFARSDVATTMLKHTGMGAGETQNPAFVQHGMSVRRLTPVECERLQGFPDNHTLIPWKGKPASDCPDGPRYKALGNSMAVPVIAWIARKIAGARA